MGEGLKQSQNGYIWSTFVVPRLLYGLESILLSKKVVECLEKFQRKCLKQIQGLPDKTANSISLALLGVLPLDAVVHKMLLLTSFRSIQLADYAQPTWKQDNTSLVNVHFSTMESSIF